MADATQQVANLVDAIVEDIMKAPDEEILLEALTERFEHLRKTIAEQAETIKVLIEDRDFIRAQLAGERKNIAGWIAARDAQLARAEDAERQLRDLQNQIQAALV